MGIFLVIIVLLSSIIIIGLIIAFILYVQDNLLNYEEYSDIAIISKTEYGANFSSPLKLICGIINLDDGFDVSLEYEGEEYWFDSEDLYKHVEVGDFVFVTVHKGKNKHGDIKNVYLTICEA